MRVLTEPQTEQTELRPEPVSKPAGPWALWRQLLLAALIAGLAYFLWTNEGKVRDFFGLAAEEVPRSNRAATATPVIAAKVGEAEDQLTYELVGTGRALRSVMLRSKGAGLVTSASFSAGAEFASGDVLMTLDDHDQRNALALAEARLAEAQRVLERQEKLVSTGASTGARVDEARTAAEIAVLEVEAARRALDDRTMRAPFDGVTGLAQVDTGDRVESDASIASFDDNSAVLVEFELPEALLSRIRSGMAVSASTPSWPDRRFNGEVSAIDTRVDPESRTARVRILLPNDEGLLRPGGSFTVRLQLPGETYPTVPELALQFSQGGLRVWRIEGDQVQPVDLRMVRRRAESVLVDGELTPDDTIVIEGTQRLSAGRKVRIVAGTDK